MITSKKVYEKFDFSFIKNIPLKSNIILQYLTPVYQKKVLRGGVFIKFANFGSIVSFLKSWHAESRFVTSGVPI